MKKIGVMAGSAALICLAVSPGTAQQAQQTKPSLKQLLVDGYEIKNVLFVPMEALQALGTDPANPQVVVTLQRGPSTAACQYSATNWFNQVATSIEGTTQCDVYR